MAARRFLVPILLPLDPVAAMEAATKQYVDSKAAAGVVPPAQAGPRADAAAVARFGHNAANGSCGWDASSDGGLDFVVNYAKTMGGFERNQANTAFTQFFEMALGYVKFFPAGVEMFRLSDRPHFYGNPIVEGSSAAIELKFRDDQTRTAVFYATAGTVRLYDLAYGDLLELSKDYGLHVWPGDIWMGPSRQFGSTYDTLGTGQQTGSDYTLLWAKDHSETYLNAASNKCGLRIANADLFNVTTGQINANKRMIIATGTLADGTWGNASLICMGGSDGQRVALNSPGVAPQLRATQAEGDTLAAINNPASDYSPFKGKPYITTSTLTMKRDVRTFGRERERITVRDWQSDEVPRDLSIMDLRPVTFRPKIPQYRVADDGTSVERDPATILGRQGLREHLGLVAEEVATVIPSAVIFNDLGEDPGIDYTQITVALLEHVQRLTDEVATLRYRIAELEKL